MSTEPTRSRWRTRLLWVAGALALVAGVVAFMWDRFGPDVRGFARRTLETQLANLLQGEVHIDRVDALDLGGIVAVGVTVLDPQKRPVLHAERLELDMNLYELAQNRLRFTRGHMVGARIRSYASPEGAAITLFDALMPKGANEPTPPDAEPSTFQVFFENIHIERGQLYGDVPGLSGLRAENLEVKGHIRVKGIFEADVTKVTGTLVAPFALPFELAQATTQVLTEPLRIRTLARLNVNQDKLRVTLSYSAPAHGPDHLALLAVTEPASSDLLRAFDISIASSLISPFEGAVRLDGPLDHLTFGAALRTDAGPLVVRGDMPDAGDLRVHVETQGLELNRLLAYFPPVKVQVSVDSTAPKDGPVTINARAPLLDVLGVAIQDTELVGRYAHGRFDIDHVLAFYAGGRFSANGWVDENADGSLHIRSVVPDVSRDPTLRSTGVRVGLRTDALVQKRGDTFSFDGDLGLEKFSYQGAAFKALQIQGAIRVDQDFLRPRVKLKGHAAGLAFEGYAADTFSFAVHGDHGRYGSDFSFKDATGRALTGHVQLEQQGENFHVLAFPFELSVGDREPWRAQADLLLQPDGIEFHKVFLANGAQRLDLKGRYSYSRAYRVEGTIQSFDLGGLRELSGLDLADLDGTLDGTLTLSGVPHQPRIDAQGSVRNGVFLGMTNLNLLLSMVFVEDRFDIDSELGLPDGSRISIYAGGAPGPGHGFSQQVLSGNYQFGMDFENVPFSVSKPWLEWIGLEPPPGTISATVRGAGTFKDPIIDVKSQVRGFVYRDWPPVQIDLDVEHDGKQLNLRELALADDRGPVAKLTAKLSATPLELADMNAVRASLGTRPFELTLSVSERRLDELPGALALDVPLLAGGSASLAQGPQGPHGELKVHATWPNGEAGIGACSIVRRPDLSLSANAHDKGTTGTLSISLDREKMANGTLLADTPLTGWLTGSVPFTPPRMDLTLHATTDTAEELPVLCEYVAGPLKVDLEGKDLFADPPDLSFVAESAALQLVPNASQGQHFGNLRDARAIGRPFSVRIKGGLENHRVGYSISIDQGNGSRADISGSMPQATFSDPTPANIDPIQANMKFTRFELAPVLVAFPIDARVSGTLDGATRVQYQVAHDVLTFDGRLNLTRGRIGVTALGQEFDDVTAKLTLKGNWLRIEDFEGHDFKGTLKTVGNVVFDKATSVRTDLILKLADFPVRQEGALVSSLSGRLRLRAEIDPQRTRSELQVLELRVNLPNDLASSLQDLDPHPNVFVVGEAPEPPGENPYVFELRFLSQKPPFRVMRTGLNAEVMADLLVRYRNPALTIEGNAELKRGDIELYGKRFELRESRMAFDGSDQLDPLVNLYAVHKVGGDEIGVRVDGRLSDPKVSFTHSDPSITDTGEIIAQLLGARSDDVARQNQDATGAAAGILAGATAGLLTEEVRKEFGGAIPVLSIEQRSNQSMRTTRIRAGVQLDQLIEKRLGPLRHVVRGAYVEGFVTPGASGTTNTDTVSNNPIPPQSRSGGLLELRFPADMVGTVEYRPVQNWRLDVAWEP
ncbi:MAG: translocation/assembly module TamB domain-containing protein [Myxococcales bacterium]